MRKKTTLRVAASALLAAALVCAWALAYLSSGLDERAADPLTLAATDFRFVVGSGQVRDDRLVISGFADGHALLSSGQILVRAASSPMLTYTWHDSLNELALTVFWRRKGDPQIISQKKLWLSGTHVIDLSEELDWTGEIIEIGFLVEDPGGRPLEVGPLTVEPDSLSVRLRRTWLGWTTFEPWSMRSVNFLRGGAPDQLLPLPLVITAWLLAALSIFWLIGRLAPAAHQTKLPAVAVALFLLAWLLLDLQWLANGVGNIRLSMESSKFQSGEGRRFGRIDRMLLPYIAQLKEEVLGYEPRRILVVGDELGVSFFLLAKAKYYLAPHSVHVARELGGAFKPAAADYWLYFGKPEDFTKLPRWSPIYDKELEVVHRGELGLVYRPVSGR